jgi:hypothetical protein
MKQRGRSQRQTPHSPRLAVTPPTPPAGGEIERAKSSLDAAIVLLEQVRRWLDALPPDARQRVMSREPRQLPVPDTSESGEEAREARRLCELINASL